MRGHPRRNVGLFQEFRDLHCEWALPSPEGKGCTAIPRMRDAWRRAEIHGQGNDLQLLGGGAAEQDGGSSCAHCSREKRHLELAMPAYNPFAFNKITRVVCVSALFSETFPLRR